MRNAQSPRDPSRPQAVVTIKNLYGKEQVARCGCFNFKTARLEIDMLTAEERALVTDIGDKLLELYTQRDEAVQNGELDRAHELQEKITETAAARKQILGGVDWHD
jgi:hypothetical protein